MPTRRWTRAKSWRPSRWSTALPRRSGLGVLVADFRAEKAAPGARRKPGPLLALAIGVWIFYLAMVSLTLLVQPFLAAATLGAFFRGG